MTVVHFPTDLHATGILKLFESFLETGTAKILGYLLGYDEAVDTLVVGLDLVHLHLYPFANPISANFDTHFLLGLAGFLVRKFLYNFWSINRAK